MFHEDNGFRDMFIYGSIAMLAAMALPSRKAHAAEIYLCNDGRLLEMTNANRVTVLRQDSCVSSWQNERQKVAISKSGGSPAQVAAAVAQSSAYQIETSAIEPLVNAIEVAETAAIPKPAALREKLTAERRSAKREPVRRMATLIRPLRDRQPVAGLRHMGDGIYAQ